MGGENVDALHAQIVAAMDAQGLPWEIVYVDDGSADGTVRSVSRRTASGGRRPVDRGAPVPAQFRPDRRVRRRIQAGRPRPTVIVTLRRRPPERPGATFAAMLAPGTRAGGTTSSAAGAGTASDAVPQPAPARRGSPIWLIACGHRRPALHDYGCTAQGLPRVRSSSR